ncbi:MAG: hypothetical protein CME62_05180 [Halobacteriovoraceae bacterium]|nr:hypothetical protein [Halobacteriovoraceae bacterium]|tara:strand:- start:11116 stop:11814 length:699 start_codon:yes stop_codon:yes gene_type:complete
MSHQLILSAQLLCFLFIVSCNQATPPIVVDECQLPEQYRVSENLIPLDAKNCLIPLQIEATHLETSILLQDFSREQEEKIQAAIARLKLVINSKEFKKRVLNFQYENMYVFVDNQGLSNEEIYEKIREGVEVLNNEFDQEIDLDATLYYSSNSTVGYTYPNTHRIWINNKFFATNSLSKVAANLMHEWLHKIGFGHDKQRTMRRAYSVPYGIGGIVRDLIEEMTPTLVESRL